MRCRDWAGVYRDLLSTSEMTGPDWGMFGVKVARQPVKIHLLCSSWFLGVLFDYAFSLEAT